MKTARPATCSLCKCDLTAKVQSVTRDMGRRGVRTMNALIAPERYSVQMSGPGVTARTAWGCGRCVKSGAWQDSLMGEFSLMVQGK
jgi:hypothetical protein